MYIPRIWEQSKSLTYQSKENKSYAEYSRSKNLIQKIDDNIIKNK